jgi:AraC-like DNA-binding protein
MIARGGEGVFQDFNTLTIIDVFEPKTKFIAKNKYISNIFKFMALALIQKIFFTNFKKPTFLGLFCLFSVISFAQVKIDVELEMPPLSKEKPLFIALDYNNWNPGDVQFKLNKVSDSKYFIVLENTPAKFDFKITQGSWMYVEGMPDGHNVQNHTFDMVINKNKALSIKISGWEKRVNYEIVVKNLPENTPKDAKIYLTGNFNNWELDNDFYELKKNQSGTYNVQFVTELSKIEFKFTRGSWETVESKASGKARPNHVIYRNSAFNEKATYLDIDGWEDLLGTLHVYSLFDFILLFSVFQGLLLIFAIPIIQNNNWEANRWLIFSIILSSAAILVYLMSSFQIFTNRHPGLLIFSDFAYFLFGPLFYFYLVKLLFNIKALPSRWYLHFIPFFIQIFAYLPLLLKNDKLLKIDFLNHNNYFTTVTGVFSVLGLLWNIYYWNLFRKTIATYKKEFQTNLSYDTNLNYLNAVLIIQFVCLCFWTFTIGADLLGRLTQIENFDIVSGSKDIAWLALSFIPYFVGYFAIQQSETFKASPKSISIFDDVLDETIESNITPSINEPLPENLIQYVESIETHMKNNKPFTNPKISLNELAGQLKMPSHLLSKIINDHFHQNFFDYINSYRVEEFKQMVKEPKNQNLTFLGLAYEVGFNSKTAFNRAFKKITNQTPREYFESIKKQ